MTIPEDNDVKFMMWKIWNQLLIYVFIRIDERRRNAYNVNYESCFTKFKYLSLILLSKFWILE